MSAKRTTKSSPPGADAAPSRGRAAVGRLRRLGEPEIERSAPAELKNLPADFWDTATPVLPEAKVPISLRVDGDVLAWFRKSGPRYQSRMNAVLRSYMERALTAAKKRIGRAGAAHEGRGR